MDGGAGAGAGAGGRGRGRGQAPRKSPGAISFPANSLPAEHGARDNSSAQEKVQDSRNSRAALMRRAAIDNLLFTQADPPFARSAVE
jgi:hypothetical protein